MLHFDSQATLQMSFMSEEEERQQSGSGRMPSAKVDSRRRPSRSLSPKANDGLLIAAGERMRHRDRRTASVSTSVGPSSYGAAVGYSHGVNHTDTVAEREGTQLVQSMDECNALINRLSQLERENVTLTNTLTKICADNCSLAAQVGCLGDKVMELARQPLSGTSVLQELFLPVPTGFFGGSKSEKMVKLEQLCQSLQDEFMDYRSSHTSSNEEVQALVTELQNAHRSAAELAEQLGKQQQRMSEGPCSIAVRVAPMCDDVDGTIVNELRSELIRQQDNAKGLAAELRRLQDDYQAKASESMRLQEEMSELIALQARTSTETTDPSNTSPLKVLHMEAELLRSREENVQLLKELDRLRETSSRYRSDASQGHTDQHVFTGESASNSTDMLMTATGHSYQATPGDAGTSTATVAQNKESQSMAEKASDGVAAAQRGVQPASVQGVALTAPHVEEVGFAMREQNCESHEDLVEECRRMQEERDSLRQQLEMCQQQLAHFSFNTPCRSRDVSIPVLDDMDEGQVLEVLRANKARMKRAEAARDELLTHLQQLREYAIVKEQEAQRAARSSEDDKKRVDFLLRKCADLTADMGNLNAARDALYADFEKSQRDLNDQRRQTQLLQEQYGALVCEHEQLETHLASSKSLEEKLVAAKETIAYMELAQNRNINMSQYAELQAEKEKLQHSVEPLQRELQDAKREVERLQQEVAAQQVVTEDQMGNIRQLREQLTVLQANEAQSKQRCAKLEAENERLSTLNGVLERQMVDMQDGIMEMAQQMDRERVHARAAAEANAQTEMDALREELHEAQKTIAEVAASKDGMISEGLYKAAMDDKERHAEEFKKRAYDLEKLKSEILIYRQTIADLESENDEHIKEIESLQNHYRGEVETLKERLDGELKRSAQLAHSVEHLREDARQHAANVERDSARIRELEESNSRQKRRFDDACSTHERLSIEVSQLRQELQDAKGRIQERAAIPMSPTVPREKKAILSSVPCAIQGIQTDAYEGRGVTPSYVQANRMLAIEHENTQLREEVQRLRKISGVVGAINTVGHGGDRKGNSNASNDLQDALAETVTGAPRADEHITELEKQVAEGVHLTSATTSRAIFTSAAEGDDRLSEAGQSNEQASSVFHDTPCKSNRKRVKRLRPKRILSEHLLEDDVNILTTSGKSPGELPEAALPQERMQRLQSDYGRAQLEVQTLRQENLSLKDTISRLTDRLQEVEEHLEAAQWAPNVGSTVADTALPSAAANPEMMPLVKPNAPSSAEEGVTASAVSTGESAGRGDLKKLRRQMRQKDAEVEALASELVEVKGKLVEYMTVTDRLGLSYPFPAEMGAATVARLKTLRPLACERSSLNRESKPQRRQKHTQVPSGRTGGPHSRAPPSDPIREDLR